MISFLLGVAAAQALGTPPHEDINARTPQDAPSGVGVTTPPPPIRFEAWRLVRTNEVTEEYELSFPSAMTTEHAENDRVPLRVFMPADRLGPVPSVILLHYWGATDSGREVAMADQLNRRGIAAVVVVMPYHMARTPKGTRSGELAIQPDPAKLVVTMAQGIWDVRRTIDWIVSNRELDAHRIGIAGTSLGAIVSSLAFGIEPRISAACFLLGGVDLAHILWNSSRVVGEREALRRRGYTEERMRQELTEIEPANYLRPSERRTLVVGAKHDTVIPPADVEKLVAVLRPEEGDSPGQPQALWLDTGHYGGVFIERQMARTMANFFDAAFRGRDYKAPRALVAPTLRIGLEANPGNGLQVALGVDLWRWSRNGDGFGAALLTPKGVQGFLGYSIGGGLSLGISFLPKRTTLGAFWSAVL